MSDDASSISNQPLIPKAAEPKDYEAAMGSLMSTYGFGGAMQPTPQQKAHKKKTEGTSSGDCKKVSSSKK